MTIRTLATIAAGAVVVALAIGLYVLTRPSDGSRSSTTTVVATTPNMPPAPPRVVSHDRPADAVANEDASAAGDGPRRERELLSAKIRDARAGYEPWDDQGKALLGSIARGAITATDVGCYMAGCIAELTFPSDDVYRRALADLQANAAYVAWTGSKQLTSPERLADGRVVIAIVLQRPD